MRWTEKRYGRSIAGRPEDQVSRREKPLKPVRNLPDHTCKRNINDQIERYSVSVNAFFLSASYRRWQKRGNLRKSTFNGMTRRDWWIFLGKLDYR